MGNLWSNTILKSTYRNKSGNRHIAIIIFEDLVYHISVWSTTWDNNNNIAAITVILFSGGFILNYIFLYLGKYVYLMEDNNVHILNLKFTGKSTNSVSVVSLLTDRNTKF